jgi:hypothetical protein
MSRKLTKEEFIEKAIKLHGNKFNYDKVDYKKSNIKVKIFCTKHKVEFLQTPNGHLCGFECPECRLEKIKESMSFTTEEFIILAKKKYGENKFDYKPTIYVNMFTKLKIICQKHGEVEITPTSFLSEHAKYGCPFCGNEGSGLANSLTLDEFLEKARLKHGDKYDYSKVKYVNSATKVIIICKFHKKEFLQSPAKHMFGRGCPDCGKQSMTEKQTGIKRGISPKRLSLDLVLKRFREIHGDRYNYSKVDYRGSGIKIIIICPEHGQFMKAPYKHLCGSGCPKCKPQYSKKSQDWLRYLNVPVKEYRLPENLGLVVDGYDPDTKTVYQFHGDYWHGNPRKFNLNDMNKKTNETYGNAYLRTLRIEDEIKSYGYNLVTIWEMDWEILRKERGL